LRLATIVDIAYDLASGGAGGVVTGAEPGECLIALLVASTLGTAGAWRRWEGRMVIRDSERTRGAGRTATGVGGGCRR
jgi:hypothetical protein